MSRYMFLAAILLIGGTLLVGCAAETAAAPIPPAFSGDRAMEWLERQCTIGPRPPGSAGIAALRAIVAAHADSLGLSYAELCFTAAIAGNDSTQRLCNLVISAGPPGGVRLWLGAHYDTRPWCDRDPDPARREEPLLGANDAASGVAVLLHLAELLAATAPPRGVDLIFFDGEDSGRAGEVSGFCVGSRHLAASWREFGNPLATGEPAGLIVLDMIGKARLTVPQEGYSLRLAPVWTLAIFERATSLGLTAFEPQPGPAIYDDHVPFLQQGIRATDLIDFDFPQWHTTGDVPAVCAAASLEQVGTLVTDICYRPLD